MTRTRNMQSKQKKHYFKQIMPYVKLQSKLAFANFLQAKPWRKALRIIGFVVIYSLFLFVAYFFLRSLLNTTEYLSGPILSICLFTLAQVLILIFSITMLCNRLHHPADLRLISVFPLTNFQRYIGEVIVIYIKLTFYSFIMFYPFVLVYGLAGKMLTASFAFSSLFATILLPLVPFAISLIVSIPFMFISSFLADKKIVKLILFLILFVGLLAIYSLLLNLLADWYIHSHTDVTVIRELRAFIDKINKPYNVCYFISEICLAHKMGMNLGIYLAISVVVGTIGVLVTKPLYHKFSTSAKNFELFAKDQKTRISSASSAKAIFINEFKQIIRTPTYAYFFIGLAVSMPLLTYLITELIKKMGEAQVGSHVFFGYGLLVLLAIITLVGSFSANTITREGQSFYITKITPISYRKQMLAKLSVNFIVTFAGLLLCILIMGVTVVSNDPLKPGLTPLGLVMLFLITTVYLIGITFNGININLVRPNIEMITSKVKESNIIIQLLIGLAITALASIVAITIEGVDPNVSLYTQLGILGAMIIYAFVNILVFALTGEKKYANLEVK